MDMGLLTSSLDIMFKTVFADVVLVVVARGTI
jgi:hypothetical protein